MSAVVVPGVARRLGLGVGFDMPWGAEVGFLVDPANGDVIPQGLARFFSLHRDSFRYAFLAFQPKNRNRLRADEYFAAYDRFFAIAPGGTRALHHTILNTGSLESHDKSEIVDFTNALIERYRFQWVVEDVGIWSLRGKSLPYPLPPILTKQGLAACVANVAEYQRRLRAPLCIEFPGFTEGSSFFLGHLDAFDFFRTVAAETDSPVTIDVGHVISYQWLMGRTGARSFEGLERLPLERCFELHLSGCSISGGRFRDLHHGVLLDEQIDLLAFFLDRCANLKAVTYEDPRFTADGALIPKARRNFDRLRTSVEAWAP